MESEVWKLLAGVLAASNTAVIWLLIKAKKNGHQESPESVLARNLAVTQIIEHIDDGERRVQENINKTRHDLRGELAAFAMKVSHEVQDHMDTHFPRRRG